MNDKITLNQIRDLAIHKANLKKIKWATIGGRIFDYVEILETKGIEEAEEAIKLAYGDESQLVINGLHIYYVYGADVYYNKGKK